MSQLEVQRSGIQSKGSSKFRNWVKGKFKVLELSQKEVQSLGNESKGSSKFSNWVKGKFRTEI